MSPRISAGTGQLTSSRQARVTRPSPSAAARARRLTRRIGETPARVAFVIMIALLAGCSSSAPTSPSASPTSATPAQTSPTAASTSPATRTFTSRQYGYTGAPARGLFSGTPATQQWDGHGAPGDEDNG